MAYTTTSTPRGFAFGGSFARFFSAVFDGLTRMAENNPRVRQLQQLSALSDEQLAARGMKREDIARRVFADRFYI